MQCYTAERADWLAGLIEAGQTGPASWMPGCRRTRWRYFCLLLALGDGVAARRPASGR